MEEWANSYLAYVGPTVAKRTAHHIATSLRHLARFMHGHKLKLADLTEDHIQQFANERIAGGNAPTSIKLYMMDIKPFLAWCRDHGLPIKATGNKYRVPKTKRKLTNVLREQALALYMQAARTLDEPYATCITLLPLTGLRVGEACSLRLDQVRVDGPWAIFRVHKKSLGERDVPLLTVGKPMLVHYLRYVRPQLTDNQWLFPADAGHIKVRSVQRRIARIRDEIGVKHLTPHTLRHTYATLLVEAGITGEELQKILGHESATTTARYYHQDARKIAQKLDRQVSTAWASTPKPEGDDE